MRKKLSIFIYTIIVSVMLFATSVFANISPSQTLNINRAVSHTTITSITNFEKYGTRYGYNALLERDLGSQRQELYNMYMDAAISFWNSSENIANNEITSIDVSSYNLNEIDIIETYFAFKNDNPIFYFASNTVSISGRTISFLTDEDYKNSFVRNLCQSAIIKGLNEFGTAINGKSSAFDIIRTLHDMIGNKINYAYKSDGTTPEDAPWAHNIMGYFDNSIKKGVCECYARALQLAMNMAGIENVFVTGKSTSTGENHAWNMAKLDDGKYYHIDATWNDQEGAYTYLGMGSEISATHAVYDTSYTGVLYQYKLPNVPSTNYKPNITGTITLKSVDDFKVMELAPNATYVLGANIDFSNKKSFGDGNSYYNITFTGTLDGKGYTIKGLKTSLFVEVGKEGKISNLKTDANFNGSAWNNDKNICPQYKSTIAYKNYGTIDKCTVTYKAADTSGRELQTVWYVGVSCYNYGKISNTTANINITSFKSNITDFVNAAGIVNENYGTISKCIGNISVSGTGSNTRIDVSGIAILNMEKGIIDECVSNGSMNGSTLGHASLSGICSNNMAGTIKNCTNNATANITTGGLLYAGGICSINNNLVENCTNNGNITNNHGDTMTGMASAIGGISGSTGAGAVIKNCTNNGIISIETGYAGGILGNAWIGTTIENCTNKGKVTGLDNGDGKTKRGNSSGGILGYADLGVYTESPDGSMNINAGKIVIKGCRNEALVYSHFGSGFAGCIVSNIYIVDGKSSIEISNCVSTGIAFFNQKYQNIVYGYYYNQATGTCTQDGETIRDSQVTIKGCDTSKTTVNIGNGGNSGNNNSGSNNSGSNNSGGNNSGNNNSGNNKPENTTGQENTSTEENTSSESIPSESENETSKVTDETTTSGNKEEDTTINQETDTKDNANKDNANKDKSAPSTLVIVFIIIAVLAVIVGGGIAAYMFVIKKEKC